jgi:D-glycero-D-manno-heptose 1,7-bisphosphate phosphatase
MASKDIQEHERGDATAGVTASPRDGVVRRERAIFVDRDGVLNDLVYNKEEGRVLSPFSARELRVFPHVPEAVKRIREELGFKVIVISNQPGVAKRQFSYAEFERMNAKIRDELAKNGSSFDAEYYCLHHPSALVPKYKLDCDCRKPKPGMLVRAAEEHDIDLARSYFVGDALVDVKAGRRAGCKTILVGHPTTLLSQMMEREDATPDFMVPSLKEVPQLLVGLAAGEKGSGQKPAEGARPGARAGRLPEESKLSSVARRGTSSGKGAVITGSS